MQNERHFTAGKIGVFEIIAELYLLYGCGEKLVNTRERREGESAESHCLRRI